MVVVLEAIRWPTLRLRAWASVHHWSYFRARDKHVFCRVRVRVTWRLEIICSREIVPTLRACAEDITSELHRYISSRKSSETEWCISRIAPAL
jgi:hypothetical protein